MDDAEVLERAAQILRARSEPAQAARKRKPSMVLEAFCRTMESTAAKIRAERTASLQSRKDTP